MTNATKIGATIHHAINDHPHRQKRRADPREIQARFCPQPILQLTRRTEQRPHKSTTPEDNLQGGKHAPAGA